MRTMKRRAAPESVPPLSCMPPTAMESLRMADAIAKLDPRWEWHLVQRLGMPDVWIKIRCLHTEVVPVESVAGTVVAQLCLTCDTQLPPPLDASPNY
jgi:hypothetical protein